MKINVTVNRTQVTKYTYEITGVNSLEAAKKCALRAANRQYQPNAWLSHTVPYPPDFSVSACEIVEVN